jgi:predicted nucleotidyltransferase
MTKGPHPAGLFRATYHSTMSNDALLPVTSDQIEQFARRWGVRELSLFGSMARGEATPSSDIDLMIQFLPGDNWD